MSEGEETVGIRNNRDKEDEGEHIIEDIDDEEDDEPHGTVASAQYQ
jgi:hypothetical protein